MRRIGLVGFGSIAENGHLPAWQSFEDVEVAAIADISCERLDRARQLVPGAALFDTPLDLIQRADVDAVDICTPPATHLQLIIAACERGLADIVCEKPLVLSEEEYVRVARAREESGCRVVSVNNWAHSELNRSVAGALAEDTIGPVTSVDIRIGRPDCALGNGGWNPRWRTDLTHAGGGIILDHGWHQLYLLMGWMREPVETISARTRTVDRRHFPVEDEAVIDMHFPRGRGHIELSWAADARTNEGTIHGTRGTIRTYDDHIVIENGGGRRAVPFGSRVSQSSYHPDWFQAVFEWNILVKDRREADRNFAEAGVLVSAIRAAYRSARENGAPCRPELVARDPALSGGAHGGNGDGSGGMSAE